MQTRVRGATPEERAAARRQVRCQRRLAFYVDLMGAATSGYERLRHACDFMRAVAKDMTDVEANAWAAEVAQMAERRNET